MEMAQMAAKYERKLTRLQSRNTELTRANKALSRAQVELEDNTLTFETLNPIECSTASDEYEGAATALVLLSE